MDVPEVSCAEAVALRDTGAAWIDVREPHEWIHARIEGTELLPMQQAVEELPGRFPAKDATIVLSCHSGARSGNLVGWLRAQGYTDVHNLRGGILAWAAEDRPVTSG